MDKILFCEIIKSPVYHVAKAHDCGHFSHTYQTVDWRVKFGSTRQGKKINVVIYDDLEPSRLQGVVINSRRSLVIFLVQNRSQDSILQGMYYYHRRFSHLLHVAMMKGFGKIQSEIMTPLLLKIPVLYTKGTYLSTYLKGSIYNIFLK